MDKISDFSSEFCKFESYGGKHFFVKMILEPPMYIIKSFEFSTKIDTPNYRLCVDTGMT